MKITTLTSAQQADLQRTYEEWLAIGRSTQPIDQAAAREAIAAMYAAIGEERPAVLFFSSPLMVVLAFAALRSLRAANTRSSRRPAEHTSADGSLDALWTQLETQLRTQLGTQLRTQLETQLRTQLRTQLETQLWTQLRTQLETQLETQLRTQLETDVREGTYWNYLAADHWCAWKVFYDFCRRIGVKYTGDQSATLDLWIAEARTCHWWWPYKGLVLASERPTTLHVNERGELHCETGLALGYADGWGVYALNGVRVPDWLVTTPARDLDPRTILKADNAEVRREIVRKVGIERVCDALDAKVIDAVGDYELLELDLQDGRRRPYLKMRNPSIGVFHIEGVHPRVKTVRQALNWRAESALAGQPARDWQPSTLT